MLILHYVILIYFRSLNKCDDWLMHIKLDDVEYAKVNIEDNK